MGDWGWRGACQGFSVLHGLLCADNALLQGKWGAWLPSHLLTAGCISSPGRVLLIREESFCHLNSERNCHCRKFKFLLGPEGPSFVLKAGSSLPVIYWIGHGLGHRISVKVVRNEIAVGIGFLACLNPFLLGAGRSIDMFSHFRLLGTSPVHVQPWIYIYIYTHIYPKWRNSSHNSRLYFSFSGWIFAKLDIYISNT